MPSQSAHQTGVTFVILEIWEECCTGGSLPAPRRTSTWVCRTRMRWPHGTPPPASAQLLPELPCNSCALKSASWSLPSTSGRGEPPFKPPLCSDWGQGQGNQNLIGNNISISRETGRTFLPAALLVRFHRHFKVSGSRRKT